jgi:hypothetical protein
VPRDTEDRSRPHSPRPVSPDARCDDSDLSCRRRGPAAPPAGACGRSGWTCAEGGRIRGGSGRTRGGAGHVGRMLGRHGTRRHPAEAGGRWCDELPCRGASGRCGGGARAGACLSGVEETRSPCVARTAVEGRAVWRSINVVPAERSVVAVIRQGGFDGAFGWGPPPSDSLRDLWSAVVRRRGHARAWGRAGRVAFERVQRSVIAVVRPKGCSAVVGRRDDQATAGERHRHRRAADPVRDRSTRRTSSGSALG